MEEHDKLPVKVEEEVLDDFRERVRKKGLKIYSITNRLITLYSVLDAKGYNMDEIENFVDNLPNMKTSV